MTLQDLGSVGEFVAAIATLVTLVYLAFQIRHNTRAVRAASAQSVVDAQSEMSARMSQDPELARIFFSGLSSLEDLDESERQRFDLVMLSLIRRWENIFYQWSEGMLPNAIWTSQVRSLEFVFAQRGAQSWWRLAPGLFSDEFVSFLESSVTFEEPAA